MLPGFSIIHITDKQSKQVIDLILPIQQLEFGVAVTIQDQPDLLDIDGFYLAPGGGFWGVFYNTEIIGTIALINIGHSAGAIRKMFVKKEFRGKEFGIAQHLLSTLETFALEHGLYHIYLGTVPVLKAAQRFYERNGFENVTAEALPPYFPRMHADELFYRKSLR